MSIKIRKRLIIRCACYGIAICSVLSGYLVQKNNETIKYKEQLKNIYLHEISDFSHYLSNIENDLTKEIYSGTGTGQARIAADLLSNAVSAKDSLSEIPFGDSSISDIYNFLSKIEDFSKYIIATTNDGTNNMLYDGIDNINYKLNQLLSYSKRMNKELKNVTNIVNNIDGIDNAFMESEINSINNAFGDYNELTSNGPYNYHINNMPLKFIEDKDMVSKEYAQKHAAEFINVSEDSLNFVNEMEGKIPAYVFNTNGSTIAVTKSGGLILYYTNPTVVSIRKLNFEEASRKAEEFLNQKGISNMKGTYFSISGNICTINYVYYEDEILYYNDLIKVSVSLDNGDILGFQSDAYITNHIKREISPDHISELAARKCLNPNLNAIKSALAYITTFNDHEDLCYEFECISNDNKKIVVYINAFNKTEESILILTDDENNKFTI